MQSAEETNAKIQKEKFSMRGFAGKTGKYLTSPTAFLVWLVVASVLLPFRAPIFSLFLFLGAISLILVFCDDTSATTLPFLLMCIYLTQFYDSFSLFSGVWWAALPPIACVIFHFVYYHRPWHVGTSFWGLVAVSVPLLTAGAFTHAEYSGTVIYHMVFLGVGMAAAYLLMSSDLFGQKPYDVTERLFSAFLTAGTYACVYFVFLVVSYFNGGGTLSEFWLQPANNLCTFLLIFLPVPLYRLRFAKRLREQMGYAVLFCLFSLVMLCSGSRGGLLLTPILTLVCFTVFAVTDRENRRQWVAGCAVCSVLFVAIVAGAVLILRGTGFDLSISDGEQRMRLIRASLRDFLFSPLFGVGMHGTRFTTALKSEVAGALHWYHMMVPQIIGSMGLIGIIGYLALAHARVKTFLSHVSPKTTVLFLCYLGMFLMSQVNPGEFCPLPYELVAVLLFIYMEREGAFSDDGGDSKEQESLQKRTRILLRVLGVVYALCLVAGGVVGSFAYEPDEVNGWRLEEGGYRYYDAGTYRIGWQEIEGNTYYFSYADDGYMVTGANDLVGITQYFREDGTHIRNGWVSDKYGRKYLADATPLTGWQEIEGKTYYFYKTTGYVATGTVTVGGKPYVFSDDGVLQN